MKTQQLESETKHLGEAAANMHCTVMNIKLSIHPYDLRLNHLLVSL